MGVKRAIAAAAAASAMLLSGCTTSDLANFGKIDSTRTTAIAPGAGNATRDISAADLTEGKNHFRDANYGLAEKHFRKAVELRATNQEAWMGLAAAYDQLGRFDFADRAYDQLVQLAGRKPRIVNNMGYSALLRGDRKKAGKLLAEASAALPDDPRVAANLALLARK